MVSYTGAGVSSANREFLHINHQGSVIALSDSSGNVTTRNTYDEYGIPATTNKGRFGYTGQLYLAELGLYHYKARIYAPEFGRFLQTDPIGYADGMNIYAYVGNDPVNAVDPTGMATSLVVNAFKIGRAGYKHRSISGAVRGVGRDIAYDWNQLGSESTATAEQQLGSAADLVFGTSFNESAEGEASEVAGNTNPYDGPVAEPVVAVDKNGNAIPVGEGEQIVGSGDGDYQQVLGKDGEPTGARLDRGGHRNQKDPRAKDPHAHQPGVTLPDGNPHLPIN